MPTCQLQQRCAGADRLTSKAAGDISLFATSHIDKQLWLFLEICSKMRVLFKMSKHVKLFYRLCPRFPTFAPQNERNLTIALYCKPAAFILQTWFPELTKFVFTIKSLTCIFLSFKAYCFALKCSCQYCGWSYNQCAPTSERLKLYHNWFPAAINFSLFSLSYTKPSPKEELPDFLNVL